MLKPRRVAWLAWSLGAFSVAAILAGIVLQLISPPGRLPEHLRATPAGTFDNLVNFAVPIIGALIASRRSEISLGWLFLVAGLGIGLGTFGSAYAAYGLLVEPGALPAPHFVAWLGNWSWTLAVGAIPLLLLLFPTGRLHSRRWRPVAWIAVACYVAVISVAMLAASVSWSEPFLEDTSLWTSWPWLEPVFFGAFIAVSAMAPVGLASTFLRFRRARGEERQQLKWFAVAAAFFVLNLLVGFFVDNVVSSVAFSLAALGLWVAIGLAILKYRLYDIDLVINKGVVFGALAAFFTAVYVAVVVGIGAVVGSRANTVLTVAAAVLIAVAFQPVRQRARHLANRLVYGKRATPYEVLSEFAERMTAELATEDLPSAWHGSWGKEREPRVLLCGSASGATFTHRPRGRRPRTCSNRSPHAKRISPRCPAPRPSYPFSTKESCWVR
jgi:two-component system NarL family sensor kinase